MKTHFSTTQVYIVSIVLIAFFTGCSKGPAKGVIRGKATLDGTLIKIGTIRFEPIDGKTGTAGGKIIAGEYQVTTPINKFKVSINATDESLTVAPINDDAPLAKNLIPLRYNTRSELVVDIHEGENHKDFVLTSR